jgi:Transcriptional regulator, AbiEi antitoxin, Type IV TA system
MAWNASPRPACRRQNGSLLARCSPQPCVQGAAGPLGRRAGKAPGLAHDLVLRRISGHAPVRRLASPRCWPRTLARGGRPDVLVSVPERAVLELLSDVGKSQGIDEARHLVVGARSLRMDVLDILLTHLKRIKVARLAHSLADELGLPWADLARRHSVRLGGGRRWVSATKTGERLNLKRPS